MVKRELGPSAMILHTRTYKRGGILGIGARPVVEITASDDPRLTGRKTRPRAVAEEKPAAPVISTVGAAELIKRTYAAAKAEMGGASTAIAEPPTMMRRAASAPLAMPRSAGGDDQLADEMRTVKRMVERMLAEQRRTKAAPAWPEKLFDQYLALLKQEVAEEVAEEVIQQVQQTLTPQEMEDEQAVRRAALDAVAKYMPTADGSFAPKPTPDGRPRTIALIGPTGVGKTTTVAKLAATYKLKQGMHVGLITLDTYRIAAVDQLRTYADIIGLPLHVVNSPAEMTSAIHKCRGCDVVLIDTAGRSQRDDPRLQQLRGFIDAAEPHEVHLVLASTCTEKAMLDAVERFSAIRTDQIIFTKMDEAVTFGVLLNVARQVGKQFSFITTGQEVPHQIEVTQAARLAELVLGGEL